MDTLTDEAFLKHLRDALNHLHDPDRLRSNPLAVLFGMSGRVNTPFLLQDLLMNGIDALRPPPDARADSQARRNYDLLLYRYVQQLDQQEVADQLGLSVRQLGREQRVALEALGGELYRRLLPIQLPETSPGEGPVEEPPVELSWLQETLPDEPADLGLVLPAVLEITRQMALQRGVTLDSRLSPDLPGLAVHPVALRQMLINVLTAGIGAVCPGVIGIHASLSGWEIQIQVVGQAERAACQPMTEIDGRNLTIARHLARICGGRLAVAGGEKDFLISLTLPAAGQVPVLVIDDNADALQLLQRYASGSRFRLVTSQDPTQAVRLIGMCAPRIILLDVMMPQMDGWEVLARLREHPASSHLPIIICTILAQEELALSLGASAFIQKPVTRHAFLAALSSQLVPAAAAPG